MPYDPQFTPGGANTVTINGVTLQFKNFKINQAYKNEDTTTTGDFNSLTGLVNNRVLPIQETHKITFDALVDASNDVLATLNAGNALVQNVVFTFGSGKVYTYPEIALDSIDITSGVMNVNSYSVSATSNGPMPARRTSDRSIGRKGTTPVSRAPLRRARTRTRSRR